MISEAEARVAALFGLGPDAPHLEQALTHPSFSNEQTDRAADNQRLEFLGDAVLGLCTSELLWRRFPDADEGTLTRMRAQLVNADALADHARAVGLADGLRLGRGAQASGLRASTNVLADAVEALLGAVYLDLGLAAAQQACARVIARGLDGLAERAGRDAKSELQERAQARGDGPPSYAVVDSGGPAHARWFVVEVTVAQRVVGRGRGRSKRLAEREAAEAALAAWQPASPSDASENIDP